MHRPAKTSSLGLSGVMALILEEGGTRSWSSATSDHNRRCEATTVVVSVLGGVPGIDMGGVVTLVTMFVVVEMVSGGEVNTGKYDEDEDNEDKSDPLNQAPNLCSECVWEE